MTEYERESLKELRLIRKELQKLNSKIMQPPKPDPLGNIQSTERTSAQEIISRIVSIDDLNAMINKDGVV